MILIPSNGILLYIEGRGKEAISLQFTNICGIQVYSYITQRDSILNLETATASKQLATVSVRDSSVMKTLAAASKQDSSAMKTIALLTMIFLPATFVSVSYLGL